MTATQRTTDRSRSETTLNPSRRTQRHRAKPNHPHGMFQSKPPPRFCAHAHQQPQTPAKTIAHTRVTAQRSRRCPPARPAAARSLSPSSSLSSALQILLLSPPLQSVICPTTALVHTRPSTLHQLLPVPGPDPARLPLWWLGGVWARHRPQTPYLSRVGCGRRIHSSVRTRVRTDTAPLYVAQRGAKKGLDGAGGSGIRR